MAILLIPLLFLADPDAYTQHDADLHHLPDVEAVNEAIRFGLEFRHYSRHRAALTLEPTQRQRWFAAEQEAKDRLTAWELLHVAQGGLAEEDGGLRDSLGIRRLALKRLLDEIGDDAFWRGVLPWPIPVMEEVE